MEPLLDHPWLVAAWPGMGGVGQIAATYLLKQLGAVEVDMITAADHFDVRAINVENGLIQPVQPPRTRFFAKQNPGGRDLLILIGEQQPTQNAYAYCDRLLDMAGPMQVQRVFTFAAMAASTDPTADSRVYAISSEASLLAEIHRQDGVLSLEKGEISGLNGVFLAAAMQRNLPGACLLGEMPFFATGIANPKASCAVLEVFCKLAGIQVDLTSLAAQGRDMEDQLSKQLEQLQQQFGSPTNEQPEFPSAYEDESDIDPAVEKRIEELFAAARKDRAVAMELKAELDRLDLFKRYEDRFLDLFKSTE